MCRFCLTTVVYKHNEHYLVIYRFYQTKLSGSFYLQQLYLPLISPSYNPYTLEVFSEIQFGRVILWEWYLLVRHTKPNFHCDYWYSKPKHSENVFQLHTTQPLITTNSRTWSQENGSGWAWWKKKRKRDVMNYFFLKEFESSSCLWDILILGDRSTKSENKLQRERERERERCKEIPFTKTLEVSASCSDMFIFMIAEVPSCAV